MSPTRRQKRWSGRFRTAGALLLLLGGVALADTIVTLRSPAASPFVTLAIAAGFLGLGGVIFILGRRWK